MENNNKDAVSATGGIKQSSTPDWRTKRLADIYKCLKYVAHTSRCRVEGCKFPTCNKLKKIIQHAKTCKLTVPGGCPLCKQLICLCCYHAKDCKEPACRFLYCIQIKKKLKKQQSQKKQTAHAQDLKKRIIAMEKHKILHRKLQQETKHSKSSTQISSAGQPCSKLHSPPSDPTSSSGPPIGAVLAVKEVQAAAARQAAQAPKAKMILDTPGHMLKAGNATSQENSENVPNQQSHQDTQLGTHNTPVQSSGGSNSESDSIESTIEMLTKLVCKDLPEIGDNNLKH